MEKRKFTAIERHAVFTVNGETCYMCSRPIDLQSMEVDHIIPEHLLDDPAALQNVLTEYGLPDDFDLQDYPNWGASCSNCNSRKGGEPFRATPIIQKHLAKAARLCDKARQTADAAVSNRLVSRALNTLERAKEKGEIPASFKNRIKELMAFIEFQEEMRPRDTQGTPLWIGPGLRVILEKNGVRYVEGPYGRGAGPAAENVDPSFLCICGSTYWSGARCVVCGEMSDD